VRDRNDRRAGFRAEGFRAEGFRTVAAELVLAGLLLVGAPAQAEPVLRFQTEGGDAWSFRRAVEGTVSNGACADFAVLSPAGQFPARLEGNRFSAEVLLREGANEVRAVCRGEGMAASARQVWTVRLRDVPKAWAGVTITAGTILLDADASRPAPSQGVPIVRYEWRTRPGNPAPLFAVGSEVALDELPVPSDRLELGAPTVDGDYHVSLRVTDALGRTDESAVLFRVDGGRPVAVDPGREHPDWVDRAVIYGVVPPLFGPRGLADVTDRLDELAGLGINVLWLSPITDSPQGDFGYAVTDHFRVRTGLGSEADLRRLVEQAHARGIRVILDFVPNHLSDRHPYYRDAAEHGAASPYFGFFDRGPDGEPSHYFTWTNLKNLNYANPDVRQFMIEAFAWWVREIGIDGFRVDASWGVKDRAPDFWPVWRAELKRIRPDLLLLAESSARDPYYFANGFDAGYDWTDRLGEWAWQEVFADPAHIPQRLRAALTNDGAGYDPDAVVFRFLNNNDTGARFITRHGVGLTRVAAALLLTLPGIPGLYTGEEIGAEFEPYAGPPPIRWTDPHGLRSHYARLIALRQAEPALRSRTLQPVGATPGEAVFAFRRPGDAPDNGVLVVLNFSSEPVTATLVADSATTEAFGEGAVVDLLSGERFDLDRSSPSLTLPAFGARVLKSEQAIGVSD
jgi:cyclomaltodextrinase / maltogenic alpha-amylase / neopullulanase